MLSKSIEIEVKAIIEKVRQEGDAALIEYTKRFDRTDIESIRLPLESISDSKTEVSASFKKTISEAIDNITAYHVNQLPKNFEITRDSGVVMGQRILPLSRVALYIPGGTAIYPSTVLMNAIPARIAGVKEIVVLSPPDSNGELNPHVLYACHLLGITEIYRIGGAQAIAAASYGTESIKKVDKIVGPGNQYVTMAKKMVFGDVAIDMIAGPSEIAVIADSTASPAFIASDLMAQAEHDANARLFLITTDENIAKAVIEELRVQCPKMSRSDIISKVLDQNFEIQLATTIDECITIANSIAPEHLELAIESPFDYLDDVINAGAIFLGHYTPETLGDYYAGTNHTLPTNGTARFSSPLGVYDFIKRPSYLYYTAEALKAVSTSVQEFADIEGLTAHKNALEVRNHAGKK
jgi:histidinol dehydrogenase